ncbi:hypothetical protein ACERJO_12635, partial [Halalkalibacter sp. AB-rgal2]|uniref:hypothetical protein n=1 Tax=Halalkalibacter sp. AB-rgal2 TaxID=3242695 RepID=UPI00359CFD40
STVPEGTASSVKEPMDRREEGSRKATCPLLDEWLLFVKQQEGTSKRSLQEDHPRRRESKSQDVAGRTSTIQ